MRKAIVLVVLAAVVLCTLCALPFGYNAYLDRKRYQADEATTIAVATQLGYTPERHIRLYHKFSNVMNNVDVIGLAFSTDDSFESFNSKVYGLGLTERFHDENDPSVNHFFLRFGVNFDEPEKKLTLNYHYTVDDFRAGHSAPNVVRWSLLDEQRRFFDIQYAQAPSIQDVWRYGDEPISGDIVVVEFDREGPVTPVDGTEFWIVAGLALTVIFGGVVLYIGWRQTGQRNQRRH